MVNNKILILVKSTNKYALAIENILKAWKIIGWIEKNNSIDSIRDLNRGVF